MIRLIALDLDGTVLDECGEIAPGVQAAVGRARDAGVRVAVCTGRSLRDSMHILDALSLEEEVILNGGSLIYHKRRDEMLHHHAMPYDTALAVTRLLRENRCFTIAFVGKTFLVDEVSIALDTSGYAWHARMGDDGIVPALDEYIETADCRVDKLMMLGTPESCERARALVSSRFPALTIVSSAGNNIEISAPGADKGTALALLATRLGLHAGEVAAVGDSLNDAAMLRYAGLPIVMGNAREDIRALGKLIAPPHSEDGAAWAIDEMLRRNAAQSAM